MHETFCSLPWTGLDISPQGEFTPCCKYSHSIAGNIDSYLSSQELKNLKEDFLNGKKPAGCFKCWKDEELGIASKRQIDLKYTFNNTHPDLNSYKIISMPFGNTCNFACSICSSYSSSFWNSQAKKIKKEIPEIKIYNHKKFYKNESFVNKILELSKNVILFEFAGGEPFLTGVKEHLNFLHTLSKYNPKKLSLHYVTNTSIFPQEEFWNLWKEFKKVNITLSIDGVSKQFEYNRWPGNWDTCYKNIKKYQNRSLLQSNVQLSISHSVSIFTVYYLPEFLYWCQKENLPSPYLGLLTYPNYLAINNLPKKVKEQIIERSEFKIKKLEPIVNELQKQTSHNFETTIKYIKMLDIYRKQNFADTFPEMIRIGFPYE